MGFTETKQAYLVPRPLALHRNAGCDILELRERVAVRSPKIQAFVKRLSCPRSPSDYTPTQQTPAPFDSFPTTAIGRRATTSGRRSRHVPIVITKELIDAVTNRLQDSRETERRPSEPTTSRVPQLSSETERRLSLLNTSRGLQLSGHRVRPRHIPIIPVIPELSTPITLEPHTPRRSRYSSLNSPTLGPAMSRPTTSASRTSTLDSSISAPSPTQMYATKFKAAGTQIVDAASSQSSLSNDVVKDSNSQSEQQSSMTSKTGETSSFASVSAFVSGQQPQSMPGTTNLSGMVCNVHRCTGREPHALVGATTTILGDKLYVFGGKRVSRRRMHLTSDLYELDLIRRHWTKLETLGDIPPPRYFHSVCALGDNKLVCYGGMSPAHLQSPETHGHVPQQVPASVEQQPEVVVMSDIHVYDTPTRTWTYIPTTENPQGRYAHCASILPSSAVFTSANAPLSAIHHNPSTSSNQGTIGVALDGTGGAEMVVVGGQDNANHYIEQISVFNLRSLKWTATQSLSRSCGAYRSVVAPLTTLPTSKIGAGIDSNEGKEEVRRSKNTVDRSSAMLIYSNYNFLDVKLELQVRMSDGSLTEKPMQGQFSPPGLRFPNGGVLDNHFVVSGIYLTSSKQEYALWALDLRTLTWSRIDVGGTTFSQGSWNRGILWPRRNAFVILGNRKRSLVEDYRNRRINFSNICMIELESFGLYDNPRQVSPTSTYSSISAPILPTSYSKSTTWNAGGRPLFSAAKELGQMAIGLRELADMDLVALTGERIPVNSQLLARRWGPYFNHLLREGATSSSSSGNPYDSGASEVATLRAPANNTSRNSSITITPSIGTTYSTASTLISPNAASNHEPDDSNPKATASYSTPSPSNVSPSSRSRTLFLPHTPLTIQALLHYLYTSSLPPPTHSLSTPQILCSLLQLARPYRIDGLLEAVVERLHQVMDGRNAAALFNASAMAAGGGRGTGFDRFGGSLLDDTIDDVDGFEETIQNDTNGEAMARIPPPRIQTSFPLQRNGTRHQKPPREQGSQVQESEDDGSSASEAASTISASSATEGSEYMGTDTTDADEIWSGEVSCVVGLQKRGLRGLMEGRRMRERGRSMGNGGQDEKGGGDVRVGLGIV
ncbi:hypothetical protein MMC14_007232 [Varicellaria rhodocarpa]|nr:hypothetical protein [Varicellaria rhodocarpa]